MASCPSECRQIIRCYLRKRERIALSLRGKRAAHGPTRVFPFLPWPECQPLLSAVTVSVRQPVGSVGRVARPTSSPGRPSSRNGRDRRRCLEPPKGSRQTFCSHAASWRVRYDHEEAALADARRGFVL